jgi:hypothetical protein
VFHPSYITLPRLLKDFFSDFHNKGIRYCHWKSNEHLEAALLGDTDLDILFDGDQRQEIVSILNNSGFKLFKAASQREYSGIEDYIALDYVSGKVFHLHSHFRLSIGENYLKSYQLNFESLVLESRLFDENAGVFVTHSCFRVDPFVYKACI